jgi:NADPH-dependent curcumin reductase CurA
VPELNRQIVIAALPRGPLQVEHFALRESALPEPGPGEVLCRTLELSIDAGSRAGLQGSASYAGRPETDVVMTGTAVARVVASNAPSVPEGQIVTCPAGWQDYSVHDARRVNPVEPLGPLSWELGVLGGTGLTAYFGLLDVGQPRAGETVLVSAAAGATGSVAGQIARLKGCRVVGTAGSDEKCAVLTDRLGFDAAVNYKGEDFHAALKAACPNGIDVYFDNVGGDVLAAALRRMNANGRIVCCGVVSQYDTANPAPGPRGVPGLLVNKRLRMQGFLVFDYAKRFPEARAELARWIEEGKLLVLEDRFEGLEEAPRALVDLLAGGNVGKRTVHVAD